MEMGKIALGAQEPKICYCFAHGGHFVAPIMINGKHKGTMFAGQLIPEKFSSKQLHDLEKIAVEIDLDPGLLVKEAENMRTVRKNVIRNYSSLLFKIVETIARRGSQAAELIRAKDALQVAHDELAEANKRLKHKITERNQTEELLRKSEEKFRLISENSIDCIWIVNTRLRFTYLSPSLERIMGFKPEQWIGTKLSSHFKKKEFLKAGFIAAKGIKNYKTFTHVTFETKILNSKNDEVDVEISSKVLLNSQGKLIGLQGITRDITERKKTEKILKDSKIKLQLLYDSSSDAIMLLDEKGFFDCNEATLRLFGCANREEFCNRHPADFSPPTQPDGTDSLSYTRNNIAVALKEGSKRFEHLYRRLDGTDFPAEVLLDALVLKDKKVLQARVYDITEQKAAQEAIRESKKRYKTLFKFGMDGILIANIETKRFEYANPAICKMLGYSAKELKRMSLSDIHPKDNLERVISEFEAQARGEKTLAHNIPCLRKDGTIIYADINTTVALVDGKKCNIGLFRDNSERKAAEEELKKRTDELEKFNRLAVGRELKMIKLKKEINTLLEESGKEPEYKIVIDATKIKP